MITIVKYQDFKNFNFVLNYLKHYLKLFKAQLNKIRLFIQDYEWPNMFIHYLNTLDAFSIGKRINKID